MIILFQVHHNCYFYLFFPTSYKIFKRYNSRACHTFQVSKNISDSDSSDDAENCRIVKSNAAPRRRRGLASRLKQLHENKDAQEQPSTDTIMYSNCVAKCFGEGSLWTAHVPTETLSGKKSISLLISPRSSYFQSNTPAKYLYITYLAEKTMVKFYWLLNNFFDITD